MSSRNFFSALLICSCIILVFSTTWVGANNTKSNYDADISYMVADFKYSQKDGVKICEVQHGSLSAMDGDIYVNGGDGKISPKIAEFFTQFPMKKWAVGIIYPPLKRSLAAKGWDVDHTMQTLFKDPTFLKYAALLPVQPSSINSYAGIVYGDFDTERNFKAFHKAYPGILFINAATFSYWDDKFKMNNLFNLHEELKQYKAEWQLHPRKYDTLLAEQTHAEMPAEMYVIKPRNQTLANGIIIVPTNELDMILKMILDPSPDLKNHPDKKYAYWGRTKDETFLLEKYYKSDYLSFSHPLNEKIVGKSEYHYDATMRIAFVIMNDGGKVTYHSMGGFWKLPLKALEEEGTLNEKRITFGKPPFYQAVNPKLLKEADAEMEKAMLLLYETMLIENSQPG